MKITSTCLNIHKMFFIDTRVFNSVVSIVFPTNCINIKNYLTTLTENEPFGISFPPNFMLMS